MDKNQISLAEYLQRIDERQIKLEKLLASQKKVLTLDEVAAYTGLSKSYLYKLTSSSIIPHHKPGKQIYFDREELEQWLLRNRVSTVEEIESQAATYATLNKGGAK